MATRVKPVKKRTHSDQAGTPENAVHFYREGIDTRPRPTGSLLTAFARYGGASTLYCQTFDSTDYDDFVARVARLKLDGVTCRYVQPGDPAPFADAPVLRIADGEADALVWRRHTLGDNRYSVVSEISDLTGASGQRSFMDWFISPTMAWDALVFPSKSLKKIAEQQMGNVSDYLAERFGSAPDDPSKRVVIPPGIPVDAYAESDETGAFRMGVRQRLGIGDHDFCALVTGHFAFYQRMHPTPLLIALEMAARRTGVRIHLLMAGWFDTAKIERTYRDLSRDLAPAVNVIFLDGRDREIRRGAWYAADTYAAFQDSIGMGIDPEMLEAMAAGLPVVAADWGANADFVSNGQEGYTIPTWLPLPGSGTDLSLAPERAIVSETDARSAAILAGTVSQMTSLDIRSAADAFEALARDDDQRRQMAENARSRVRETCDWPVVVRRHQALWADLRKEREQQSQETLHFGSIPHLDDPFRAQSAYASGSTDVDTQVSLMPGLRQGEGVSERLSRVRANPLNDIASRLLLSSDEMSQVLNVLTEAERLDVARIAAVLPENRRYRLPRTLGWLAKMGIVVLSAGEAIQRDGDAEPAVSRVALGLAARKHGDSRDAAAYFEDVLHDHPVDLLSHLQLGEIMAEENDFEGAVEHFEKAVDVAPESVEAWLDMGKAQVLRGDPKAGIAALENAATLAPQNSEVAFSLGAAYRRVGNATDAVTWLEKAVRINPRHEHAFLHLGYARKSMGRRAEALQAFRDALRLAPNSLVAKSGELSMGVERRGRDNVERDANARRVALHVGSPASFRGFSEVFARLSEGHWPLLSTDGRDIVEFDADVVLSGGTETARLRALLPNAFIISVPAFLSSQNRCAAAFEGADLVAAPSELIAQSWSALELASSDQIRVTGYPAADGIFRGDALAAPPELRLPGRYVLYAPSGAADLGTADIFAETIAEIVEDLDATLVIKPHPSTLGRREPWLQDLTARAAASEKLQMVTDAEADALPYIVHSDAVITDVSSVMFDALAADTPVVLLRHPHSVNADAYDAQGIEWRWRDFAIDLQSPDALPEALVELIDAPMPDAEMWSQYKDAVFDREPHSSSAQRIVDLITELST